MKTKKLYTAIAVSAGCLALAIPANAQTLFEESATTVTEFTCNNKTRYTSNWRDNWFIEVSAGINQPFVERGFAPTPGANVYHKKMTLTYGVGFGRWVSPYVGFRIKGVGGALHWDNPVSQAEGTGWTRSKHVNLQAELMWDMFNSLGGVNESRVFSIIPFVGLGGDANWDIRDKNGLAPAATNCYRADGKDKYVQWTLPVSAGLQFRLRLCKYVDFFGEARAMFYADNWNNCVVDNSIDANVQVMGGFNFNIGGRGWGRYNECADAAQIAALNAQVNDLRAELIGAGAEIAALQSQLPCPEPVVKEVAPAAPLMTTVRFTINSDVIMPTEEVNIYNMAQWLKQNPDQKVVISGYADKDTGTAEYNMTLSEKRADAVADALVSKYGISRDRLTVKYDGSDVQPYGTNDWNRIVIFTQK